MRIGDDAARVRDPEFKSPSDTPPPPWLQRHVDVI
jgi:hypothetical protein